MPEGQPQATRQSRQIELEPCLDAFMRFHHLSPTGMAAFLACPESAIGLVRGRTLPEERDPAFREAGREIAREMGASEARVLQWIRVAKLLVR